MKFEDAMEMREKLRASLPEMVDRETVIRLLIGMADNAVESAADAVATAIARRQKA